MSYHYSSSNRRPTVNTRRATTASPTPVAATTAINMSAQVAGMDVTKSVILKAKLNNVNVIIDQVSSAVSKQSNIVEVLILPKTGYKIQAEDFSVGYLPKSVNRIIFQKEKDSVIAVVALNVDQIHDNDNVVELPISVKVRATHHEIDISEYVTDNSDIITTYRTIFPISKIANTTTYKVKNQLGRKTLIFTRLFVVVDESEFDRRPSFVINKNKERFDVVTKSTNKTVEFKVYYTSPLEIIDNDEVESIAFSTNSRKIKRNELAPVIDVTPQGYNQPATTITYGSSNESVQEESGFKIYSFDPGRKIGSSGGVRKIRIKGVPGTPFKLMLQDSNFKTYNFEKGIYEEGGGMLQAVIPQPRTGFSYGEYLASVKVPRSNGVISYSDRFIKDTPIDHTKIQSVELANLETTGKADILTEVKVTKAATITFGLDVTGSFLTSFENLVFGPGDLGTSVTGGIFSFKVNAPAGSSIAIARQPLEAKPGAKFTAWTSGDKTTLLSAGSSGTVIQNDWSNTRVVGGSTESSTMAIKLNLTAGADGKSVKGTMSIGTMTFGEGDNTYNLKLLNFLTLTSL